MFGRGVFSVRATRSFIFTLFSATKVNRTRLGQIAPSATLGPAGLTAAAAFVLLHQEQMRASVASLEWSLCSVAGQAGTVAVVDGPLMWG